MSYSENLKPAKILNLPPLVELTNRFFLNKEKDFSNYSMKYSDCNSNKFVFSLDTADTNIKPTIRVVKAYQKTNRYSGYEIFVIEPSYNATGIAIVFIKEEFINREFKKFLCNVRILPLVKLNDIVDKNTNSEILTLNLGGIEYLLKMDITIQPSNTGEAMFSTHEINIGNISKLITPNQILTLEKELQFHGAKLAAHFCQEILSIKSKPELKSNPNSKSDTKIELSDDYTFESDFNQLKYLLLSMSIIGNIMIEIVGDNAIEGLNNDWRKSSSFLGYIL